MIVDLDDRAGSDPEQVGGKAADLAAARAAGAPVLPGFVVAGEASLGHMASGRKALEARGSGGARLAISGESLGFAPSLIARGEELGDRLVARSSTLLESSGEWSGAFTSYVDIGPADLPKAIVGCWASAFSVAALDRQRAAGVEPGSFPMSVLVQPALTPRAGGWASMDRDGTLEVHGIKGSPAPLLQGWVTGHVAHRDDGWSGDELIDLVGVENLESIREALDLAGRVIGSNRCEWALTERIWALQFGRARDASTGEAPVLDGIEIVDELVDVVRLLTMAPGALGEEMVLPWAFGGLPDAETRPMFAADPIEQARRLCVELAEEVWSLPWVDAKGSVTELLATLGGPDPLAAVSTITGLRRPDPKRASELLGILGRLRTELVESGVAVAPADVWQMDLDAIERARNGEPTIPAGRLGIGRWEPLTAAVVLGASTPKRGVPASPGVGAGRRVDVGDPHESRSERRSVLTASQPVPNLASLLWDAAGLVTSSGSPAAHLFEAARSLRVPAVCGVDLGDAESELVAVDGGSGLVATLDLERRL